MQPPPCGAQIPQLGLQQYSPAAQVLPPQSPFLSGTQAQTPGELSKCSPRMQRAFCRH